MSYLGRTDLSAKMKNGTEVFRLLLTAYFKPLVVPPAVLLAHAARPG